jgi:hypothetical protein
MARLMPGGRKRVYAKKSVGTEPLLVAHSEAAIALTVVLKFFRVSGCQVRALVNAFIKSEFHPTGSAGESSARNANAKL